MHRPALLPAVLLLAIPGVASAQITPKLPPTSTVEVITLRSVKFDKSTSALRLHYERAGTKPLEYRAAGNAAFTGVNWVPFTEGATKSVIAGPTTWIVGFVTPSNSIGASGNCGPNTIVQKVHFQFRGRNRSLQSISSNVVTDSMCTPFG